MTDISYIMKSGIYVITNLINGKMYIGQSTNLKKRLISHRWILNQGNHYNTHLQRAWDKYGEKNFSFRVLERCPKEQLNFYEKAYITLWHTTDRDFGYNLESGGSSNQTSSEETKMKISKAMKGRTLSEEHKRRIGEAQLGEKHHMFGKHLSDEQKKKLSIAGQGREFSKESLEKLSKTKGNTGFFHVSKTLSEKYRQGYFYRYHYYIDNKRKSFSAPTIKELKKKVKEKGLEWIVLDEELAKETVNHDKKFHKHRSSTGFKNVSRKKESSTKQGFLWLYGYRDENNKRKSIRAVSLLKLKEKVEAVGLPWEIVNEELAQQTLKEDSKDE